MADDNVIKDFEEKFEIVSVTGTLSPDGPHMHVALSKKDGAVVGFASKQQGCIGGRRRGQGA